MSDRETLKLREDYKFFRKQFETANSLESRAMAALRMFKSNWAERLTYYTHNFKHEAHGKRMDEMIGVIIPLISPLSVFPMNVFDKTNGSKLHSITLRACEIWPRPIDKEIPGMDDNFVQKLHAASLRLVENEKRIVGMINPLMRAKGEDMERARVNSHEVDERVRNQGPLQLIRATDPDDIEIFLEAYDHVANSLKVLKVSDELNAHLDAIKAYALEMIDRAHEEKPPRPSAGWTPILVKG